MTDSDKSESDNSSDSESSDENDGVDALTEFLLDFYKEMTP